MIDQNSGPDSKSPWDDGAEARWLATFERWNADKYAPTREQADAAITLDNASGFEP